MSTTIGNRKKESKLKKKLKQKVYKWHKALAFVTIVPMIFWCLSGLMHPFMAHFFKPEIANEKLEAQSIDNSKLKIGLKEALSSNHIAEFKNFRFVNFEENQYYQVKTKTDSIVYLNTIDGKVLTNGDKLYAEWMSRYFLDDQKSKVVSSEYLTEFNSQYKYVNRYLPVYKFTFDSPDKMEVYVETFSDKLATFNPTSRQFFICFFDVFHNWSFLDAIANNGIRITIMICLLAIIGLSALSGLVIYGLFWKQFKKIKSNNTDDPKRNRHRRNGLIFSLFALLFAFSGGFHATKKWNPIAYEKMVYEPVFKAELIDSKLISELVSTKDFKNINAIKFQDTLYYRSLIKKGKFAKPTYCNSITKKVNPKMDFEYAGFLAGYFQNKLTSKGGCCEMEGSEEESECKMPKVKTTSLVTDFKKDHDYGFVNKRLPVVKVSYDSADNLAYFIETGTSRLALKITDSDRIEGYSFAIFHKFLFMDWAGKSIRDLSMVLAAMGVLLIGISGIILLFKKK